MPNATVPAAAPGLPIPFADPAALRRLRKQLAERIERDIAFLDLLDGDPNCEPDEGFETFVQPELRGGANVRAY